MDILGLNAFDFGVIAILVIGALFGFVTGFVRGGLFVASWIGSIVATIYAFPLAQPFARAQIKSELIADLVGGAVLFIVALILLYLLSHLLSGWVRQSRLNALDRSLGLVAGIATAAILLSVGYLLFSDTLAEDPPDWLKTARTRTAIESGALLVRYILPDEFMSTTGEALQRRRDQAEAIEDTRDALDRLSAPPKITAPAGRPEYKDGPREQLDKLIQENQ